MLYGTTVRLRAVERADAALLARWLNDPEVRRWRLAYLPVSTEHEARWLERQAQRGDELAFIIQVPAGDGWRAIGSADLHAIDRQNGVAGYRITIGEPDSWSRGYGSDATRTVLAFAFGELNLHRVELGVLAGNARARRCCEKAGFRLEAVRRAVLFRDGRYHDECLMAVLREEFCAATPCV
ncbi:MAG TPA: GNAT family protein [Anaerolineae bacterium]|nr:GNAT family protein [Anaerolineae bacterium]HPL27740.1 GNAT family protein [Anaerolineae bacterium]